MFDRGRGTLMRHFFNLALAVALLACGVFVFS